MTRGTGGRAVPIAVGAVLVVAGLVLLLWRAQAPPEGPVPVAWDRVRCARCGMLVSEPRFAAQLHTEAGEVLHFDDPGDLLLHVHEARPAIREVWFHHLREDRWVPRSEVAFVPVSPTPMGHGIGAVDASTPDAMSWEAALEKVLARERERGG